MSFARLLLVVSAVICGCAGASDPPNTVYVSPEAEAGGDGSSQRPFQTLHQAVTAGLQEPPSTTTWTILMREGTYRGAGQVGVVIRDKKRFIIFFENRGVNVYCDRKDFWVDFTGLGGQGALEITGNGGSVRDCQDSAVRSRRKTFLSGISFVRNRALTRGSAVRVEGAATELEVERCRFEDSLQRPAEAPSGVDDQGGGAVWVRQARQVIIRSTVFRDNEASQGGGLYVANCGRLVLQHVTFERNLALLPEIGGGAMAVVAPSQTTHVEMSDCDVSENTSGGQAAGVYLGGNVVLDLLRVAVVNNTSLAPAEEASARVALPLGVGVLLWKAAKGVARNVTVAGNRHARGGLANLACSGPALSNLCELRWQEACDVCTRRGTDSRDLAPDALLCRWSSHYVWRWASVMTLVGCTLLALVLLASLAFSAVLLWRRRRAREAAWTPLRDEELRELELEVAEEQRQQEDDDDVSRMVMMMQEDDVELVELEPPGYGGHSSEELLPSMDFMRRSPPSTTLGTFKEIDYDELRLDADPIGSGAFGLVYRAVWRGSTVAVKKYIGHLTPQGVQDFRAEAQLLHAVGNHPNVIKLFGACTKGPNFCLVMPFYARGSVRDFLEAARRQQPLPWRMVTDLAVQVVAGMMHLHRENIVHRDLAARNILVDDSNNVRITDFGLARFLLHTTGGKTQSNVGAVGWMSPEAVAERRYSAKSDVWSFGVVLWELCTGKLPYKDVEPIHAAVAIAKGATLPIPDEVPSALAGVMRWCWATVPAERPTFDELFDLLSNAVIE